MLQEEDILYGKCQINFIEIYAPYDIEESKGKIRILTNGSSLTVENYVKKVFENEGYSAVEGGDLDKFLRFCCGGWTGYVDEAFGGKKFVALNNRNQSICNSGMIPEQWNIMIDNAYHMWSLYHQDYSPKLILASKLCEAIKIFEKDEIIGLLKMYCSRSQYAQRIDLFIFNKKTKDRQFVEVKSRNDSLRYTQLKFSLDMSKLGKNLFTIVYVLPDNTDDLGKAAEDLRKLYKIGVNKVYKGYKKTKNIETLAHWDYGVNPNCLLFFLKKTKNVCMDLGYNENFLCGGNKYYRMKEYLSRLESEWHELRTVGLVLKENEPNKSNEVVEKLSEETSKKKLTSISKKTNLCTDCWLSGNCDREKKAIKRREIIISCKGYVPENK